MKDPSKVIGRCKPSDGPMVVIESGAKFCSTSPMYAAVQHGFFWVAWTSPDNVGISTYVSTGFQKLGN